MELNQHFNSYNCPLCHYTTATEADSVEKVTAHISSDLVENSECRAGVCHHDTTRTSRTVQKLIIQAKISPVFASTP